MYIDLAIDLIYQFAMYDKSLSTKPVRLHI